MENVLELITLRDIGPVRTAAINYQVRSSHLSILSRKSSPMHGMTIRAPTLRARPAGALT